MARPDADSFAREWVAAWNDHDLDAVLSHYADGVVFHSPRIALAETFVFHEDGEICIAVATYG